MNLTKAEKLAKTQKLHQKLKESGLTGDWGLVVTTNRTRAIGFRGNALRIQEGFVEAPSEVMKALVHFIQPPKRGARKKAEAVLLAYFTQIPKKERGRRKHKLTKREEGWVAKLVSAHQELNQELFEGCLSQPNIVISRLMKRKLGHYMARGSKGCGEISISCRHLRRHDWSIVKETLIHEMIHQWQDETGQKLDHGPGFRKKARALGIDEKAVKKDLN